MKEEKLYPMLSKENKFLGLEGVDLLALFSVYLAVFLLSKNLIVNLILLIAAYFFLKSYKKNKPPRYTQNFVRFLFRPSSFNQTREVI